MCGSGLWCADQTKGVPISHTSRTIQGEIPRCSPFHTRATKDDGKSAITTSRIPFLEDRARPVCRWACKLPLIPIPVVTDRNPLGSRRADGFRLWWPRCAKGRMGDVFCCADSTLGPTQSKDRGSRKIPAHGGKPVVESGVRLGSDHVFSFFTEKNSP